MSRRYFDDHTCGQPGDEFIDAVFKRLAVEPFTDEHPINWLWRVVSEECQRHKAIDRITPETIDAILEVVENRDAILAIELPNWPQYEMGDSEWLGSSD